MKVIKWGNLNILSRRDFTLMFLLMIIMILVFVGAVAPSWIGTNVNYTTSEDVIYYHNLSANITGFNNDVTFAIDTLQTNITWTNSSGTFDVSKGSISGWIKIYDSLTGNLTINASYDNQTGFFSIPIQATNNTGDPASVTENFEFQINATNDAPNFTDIQNEYNLTQNEDFNQLVNALDEEAHYPLDFNITFINNCTHASWTGRNDNENCSILNLTETANTSASMNFTPTTDDVGTYWANVTVGDFGENYPCPHAYCVNATYMQNKTSSIYLVKFNIFASLEIDVTNCTNQNLVEGVEFNCSINITTQGSADNMDISSYADFRNWVGGYDESNRKWFYSDSSETSADFVKVVNVSFIPTKKEVGNWTINFTVEDTTYGTNSTVPIYLFVDWIESNVSLDTISDFTGVNAVYENQTFYVNASDDDLKIWDGSVKSESLTFKSNTSWVTIESSSHTSGTNYVTAKVKIDYDSIVGSGDANYSVRINVTDTGGSYNESIFVVEILNDSAAEWNQSGVYVFSSNEGDSIYINLTDGYINDSDGDSLTFSYTNGSEFSNFNLTSDGIINFTSSDVDVGYHQIMINGSDGKLDSIHEFNFTIFNIIDAPTLNTRKPTGNITVSEGSLGWVNITILDDDFYIPSGQSSFYNESLNIGLTFTNLTNITTLISFDFVLNNQIDNLVDYRANFTPDEDNVGEYNVTLNITDVGGMSDVSYFILNITQTNDAPNLTLINNQTWTINETFYLDIYANDEEDGNDSLGVLTYSVNFTYGSDFVNGNESIFNTTSGVFNLALNSTYAGEYHINVSVNDSLGLEDSQEFYLYVYDAPSLISPSENSVFDLVENISSVLNFTINHSVGNNLTYEFWIDSISCSFQNNSNCTYGNSSFEELINFYGNSTPYNWSFIAGFTDETYGNYKNLTVSVYPNSTSLNSTQRDFLRTNFSFKLNVSHTNHPPEAYNSFGSSSGTYGSSNPLSLDLSNNFRDYDYLDSYYQQNVTFSVSTNVTNSIIRAEEYSIGNRLPWSGLVDGWSLQLYGEEGGTEQVTISANDSFSTATATAFSVTFNEPSTTEVPTPVSSGGGSSTKLKYFSLKLIVPQDVIISDENYIEVPFTIQNNGQMDLRGISLGSFVRFNNEFSEDVRVSLEDGYIEELKFGQSENFTMKIIANTQRSGRYKATILANVTSPKFSDWGNFFIELRKTNESEAEQILIFTEKLIADNSECLELTEVFNEAEKAFSLKEYSNSIRLAREVTEACEDAILANEQIKYPIEGFVQNNFYYISFTTLVIFFIGFIFYVYKRVRFNKSKVEDYM